MIDIQEIRKIIPHRYPFLLIDRVVELVPNEKLVAIKNVSVNEEYFAGHFPEEKIMPGVLMIEAMAQAGCVFFHYSKNKENKKLTFYLASSKSRFLHPVTPGDQLRIEVTPKKFLSRGGFFNAICYVGDKKVAESEIGFGIKAE